MLTRKRILVFALIFVFIYGFFSSFGIKKTIAKTEEYSSIESYNGNASVVVNDNKPIFTFTERSTTSYEKYGELDSLGRCTAAIACIGKDIMPTEERGSIGSVKPTGWVQNKYPGIVESDPPYLYNRCHLIGYQLTGENANEKNLFTGTRYMNVEGMLPYENLVADYINSTGNHVLYKVTPVYEGDNLLCSGVQIEASSVEDFGKTLSFNVFCYNVQPGVDINYADGSNTLADGFVLTASADDNDISYEDIEKSMPETEDKIEGSYVANKNTKKFHLDTCESVNEMNPANRLFFEGFRQDLIDQGYVPCKRCNP